VVGTAASAVNMSQNRHACQWRAAACLPPARHVARRCFCPAAAATAAAVQAQLPSQPSTHTHHRPPQPPTCELHGDGAIFEPLVQLCRLQARNLPQLSWRQRVKLQGAVGVGWAGCHCQSGFVALACLLWAGVCSNSIRLLWHLAQGAKAAGSCLACTRLYRSAPANPQRQPCSTPAASQLPYHQFFQTPGSMMIKSPARSRQSC
jgi:hypothetical protein